VSMAMPTSPAPTFHSPSLLRAACGRGDAERSRPWWRRSSVIDHMLFLVVAKHHDLHSAGWSLGKGRGKGCGDFRGDGGGTRAKGGAHALVKDPSDGVGGVHPRVGSNEFATLMAGIK
jgi:hypothetical protein